MTKLPSGARLRAELAEELLREGYDSSSEQLRKYESDRYFSIEKMDNRYRIYDDNVVDKIKEVFAMKMIGLSLKRIKEFLDLKEQIINCPLVIKEHEKRVSEGTYVDLVLSLGVVKEGHKDEYNKLLNNVTQYLAICDEIDERIKKVIRILDRQGKKNIENRAMVAVISQGK